MTPEDVLRGANHFVMDHHNVQLPADSFTWFSFGNGDYAGWLPNGDAFMYDHEQGTVTESEFSDLVNMLYSGFNRSAFDDMFN